MSPKVVLITGGSSGLGQAMCVRLARAGHTVIGTGRRPQAPGEGYELVAMDVTNEGSVQEAVADVVGRHGRIDVLVNNAGIGIQGPAEDIPTDLAQRLFDTNVFGLHRVCRAVLPHMRAQQSGLVVNISSIAANFGLPYRAFYSASKAAVDRYSEALSIELEPFHVQVVVVQPGEFNTRIGDSRLRPAAISAAYAERYGRAMDLLGRSLGDSLHPDQLAQRVERIIQDPRPALVYRAASPLQRLSVLLKKLLPGRRFERMVSKHYE